MNIDSLSVREVYDYTQIEINKAKAPSILLEDFLYMLNKAINNYCNIKYNTFNLNQQYTDDLKNLVRTYEVISPEIKNGNDILMQDNIDSIMSLSTEGKEDINFAALSIKLPNNYYHLLNCIIKYKKTDIKSDKKYKVYTIKTKEPYRVRRVTNESLATTFNNYYYKPKLNNPYFILNNEKDPIDIKTINSVLNVYIGDLPKSYAVDKISISYLINPTKMELTEEQLYEIEDSSMKMEFPRYICYEIINILVGLIMINSGNPTINNLVGFNKTIQPIGLETQQIPPLSDTNN